MTIAVSRNLSNCEKPEKKDFGASTGFEPVASAQRPRVRIPLKPRNPFFRAFSQLLKLRLTAMVTYSFHLYSRSSHHFILYFLLYRQSEFQSLVRGHFFILALVVSPDIARETVCSVKIFAYPQWPLKPPENLCHPRP